MTRLSADVYITLRRRLAELGHGEDYTWSQNLKPPATPEALICEYTWVVLNSGMKNTVARGIMDRVWPRVVAGLPVSDVFKHQGKASAIECGWDNRYTHFLSFLEADAESTAQVLDWCESLPWIGKITKYHLAKNLGVDVAKPDRWLVRLAAVDDTTVDVMCARLASETGDRIATVDLILWRACAVGILKTDGHTTEVAP